MTVDRRAYATEAYDTINRLVPIGGATGSNAPPYYGFLGSVTNAFIPLLTIAIQQSGVAQVTYPAGLSDGQFQQLVQILHRAYYASLITAVKGACDGFVRGKGQLGIPAGGRTQFNDYLEAALTQSRMAEDRKRYWRKYFNDMRILRNKCSHFSAVLEQHEKTALINAGLGNHIGPSDDVQTQPANYVSLAERALEFIREL
jgi:hypothetical protein